MKYDLIRPCGSCPFRTDVTPYLTAERCEEILEALLYKQQTFSCHKTNDVRDEEVEETENSQHCAGALILCEREERPNQMMRIAERLGMYDRNKLDYEAPVYDDAESMQDAYDDQGVTE